MKAVECGRRAMTPNISSRFTDSVYDIKEEVEMKRIASLKGKKTVPARKIEEKDVFTDAEYKSLNKLTDKRGRIYPNAKEFLKALEKL